VVDVASQRFRSERELVRGARHPGKLRQEPAEVPRGDHGKHPTADETFPRLVGRELDERTLDELAPVHHPAHVRHNIVGKDQATRQDEPNEAVEDVVEDVLELSDR